MTTNATQVLQSLGHSLLGLNLKVADVEKGLNRVKIAALGLGGVLAGREIIEGYAKLAEAGGKLQAAQLAMASAGMTHLEIVRETAEAYRSMSTIKGPDIVERISAIRELRGIVGAGAGGHDYREINALLPNYLKVRELVGDKGGNDLFRAVEQQGGARFNASGEFDQTRFERYLDAGLRTLQAGGGNIKPRDLLNVMQMSSVTARGYDPNAFWNMMMTPILEMGGHRAGTALSAMSRTFYGGIMPERNARELSRLGVFEGGQVRVLPHMSREQRAELKQQGYEIGRGGVVTVAKGATRGETELNDPNQGFFPWLRDVFAPLLRSDYQKNVASRPGNTESFDAYVRDEMYKALPTETARRFGALIIQQLTSVQRDQTLRSQATGLSAYDIAQQGFDKQVENFQRSWKSLMETLGLPAAKDGASILQAISAGLDRVTQWAARHPTAARDLERFALGVGAVAAVSGAAAIAGVALGPLGSGLRLLAAGVVSFGPGGAAATALGGMTAATGTTSLALLAARLGVLGLAIGGAILALKLIDSVGPANPHPNTNARGMGYSGRKPVEDDGSHPKGHGYGMLDGLGDQIMQAFRDSQHPVSRNARGLSSGATVQKDAYEIESGGSIPGLQPINITLQLDGHVIARNTTEHQVRSMRPSVQQGMSDPDFSMMPMPAGLRSI